MAGEAVSLFPPPPSYYRLWDTRDDDDGDDAGHPLAPPALPAPGSELMAFGERQPVDMEDPVLVGLPELFPRDADGSIDFKPTLGKLNVEVFFNFIELLDTLCSRPSKYARKIEDIALALLNMQHLIRLLRPHQARSTLLYTVSRQAAKRREDTERLRKMNDEAKRLLVDLNRKVAAALAASSS